jgi:hypothetical protein
LPIRATLEMVFTTPIWNKLASNMRGIETYLKALGNRRFLSG